jgi:hypothetical protein
MKPTKTLGFVIGCLLGSIVSQSSLAAAAPDNGGSITAADLTTPVTRFPSDLVGGANQTQFANYAWRLFIIQHGRLSRLPWRGGATGA